MDSASPTLPFRDSFQGSNLQVEYTVAVSNSQVPFWTETVHHVDYNVSGVLAAQVYSISSQANFDELGQGQMVAVGDYVYVADEISAAVVKVKKSNPMQLC